MIEETWKRTRLAGHVIRFKMAESTCTIFSHSNLSAFVQKTRRLLSLDRTFTKRKQILAPNIFHVSHFVIEIFEKMQLIFDRDRRPARFRLSD